MGLQGSYARPVYSTKSAGGGGLAAQAQIQLNQAMANTFGGSGGAAGSSVSGGGIGGGGGGVSAGGTNTAFVDAYNQILSRLKEGGAGLEASLADIEAGKKSAIAAGEQNLVSSGLSGTTVMAGVPIAAEATAARARLQARSEAENKYLTALSNFANLAFQAKEGELGRQFSASQGAANRAASGSSIYVPESERRTYPLGMQPETGVSTEPFNKPVGSGYYGDYTQTQNSNQAQQYPAIYGQGSQQPVPGLMEPEPFNKKVGSGYYGNY